MFFFWIFTGLYNHHHNPILEHFVSPERNPVSISSHSPAPHCVFFMACFPVQTLPLGFWGFLVHQSTLCGLTILFIPLDLVLCPRYSRALKGLICVRAQPLVKAGMWDVCLLSWKSLSMMWFSTFLLTSCDHPWACAVTLEGTPSHLCLPAVTWDRSFLR